MKKNATICVFVFILVIVAGLSNSFTSPNGMGSVVDQIKVRFEEFSGSTFKLLASVRAIEPSSRATINRAKAALRDCRIHYKQTEFFLEYFFRSSSAVFNGPPKYEVEEPYIEYEQPRGLQVIESGLIEAITTTKKKRLIEQAIMLNESAKDLPALLYEFKTDDSQFIESIREELIRIMTLGIAGYDAPILKSGIRESSEALESMRFFIQPFLSGDLVADDSINYYMKKAIALLQKENDFDSFDRMDFLTHYALPLAYHLDQLIRKSGLLINAGIPLNDEPTNLFSRNAWNQKAFPSPGLKTDSFLITLGKKLFFDRSLSGNGSKSCASCHQPEKYFSDGLPKSVGINSRSLKRNAPTLLYAGYQFSQFWDGRAKSLEEQIIAVLHNPAEMNADFRVVEDRLKKNIHYKEYFDEVFRQKDNQTIFMQELSVAIAAYLRTLAPMNSRFDHYVAGDKNAMNKKEIDGFNLFMGKAQCGSCHFAPLFNGLVPPLYNRSEFEVLGVPASGDLVKPVEDTDRGRFNIFPVEFYDKAFKTPTLRNAAVTAPYMHNGAFPDLEKVMDFYNKGGGLGLGLKIPEQTLSPRPLHLNEQEIKNIIAFLNTLTDSVSAGTTGDEYTKMHSHQSGKH